MGRIMYAVTDSTDEEYGGTYDAEVENIELTVNDEYFNSIDYVCQKYGRIVFLSISGVSWKKSITTGGVAVLSGLPAPSQAFACALNALKTGGTVARRMRVLTNGNLASWYENISTDENPYGVIMYISAE